MTCEAHTAIIALIGIMLTSAFASATASASLGAVVSGYTQSRKTWKTIDMIHRQVVTDIGHTGHTGHTGQTLVIVISQSNSTMATSQIMSRIRASKEMGSIFGKHMYEADHDTDMSHIRTPVLIGGYWHIRNREAFMEAIVSYRPTRTIIVMDEADQAGNSGFVDRMQFLEFAHITCDVMHPGSSFFTILVTATIANLSKSVAKLHSQIVQNEITQFEKNGYVSRLITSPNTEYYFVEPSPEYAGPSYFKDTWINLDLESKKGNENENQFENIAQRIAKHIPAAKRRLSLIGVAHQCDDQAILRDLLLHHELYDVIVDMNSVNGKDFIVHYNSRAVNAVKAVKSWVIPITRLNDIAAQGSLDNYMDPMSGSSIPTNLPHHLPLPYVLQAALFMGTEHGPAIRARVSSHSDDSDDSEWIKLLTLSSALNMLPPKYKRPSDYPKKPCVAIVAGNMIGRGLTVQDARAGFVCTSFIFNDNGSATSQQRGAPGSQKFGRACGLLRTQFDAEPPIMLTSKSVFEAALANEAIVDTDGDIQMINLSSWIGEEEWKGCRDQVRNALNALNALDSLKDPGSDEKGKKKKSVHIVPKYKITRLLPEAQLPGSFRPVTTFKHYTVSEFVSVFKLPPPPLPSSPIDLHKLL